MEYLGKFVNYCKETLDLNKENPFDKYGSLSVCIIDCIYSLQATYYSTTVPVVKRYAEKFLDNDEFRSKETLDNFLKNIDDNGGAESFAVNILKNNQKQNNISKAIICYELARKLLLLGIHTKEDFMKFKSIELLEIVIRSVKGVGDAALNYLFMLAGDPNRCKFDVHLNRCIHDVCGRQLSDDECQELMKKCVEVLNVEYPKLTISLLDNAIWSLYEKESRKRRNKQH